MSVASFVAAQRTDHGVPHAVSCRALDLSESWFYKLKDRAPTPHRATIGEGLLLPGPIRQVRAGSCRLRGFHHWFLQPYTFLSR
jgi:hypothetical protein